MSERLQAMREAVEESAEEISTIIQGILTAPAGALSEEIRAELASIKEEANHLYNFLRRNPPAAELGQPEKRAAAVRTLRHDLRGKLGAMVNMADVLLMMLPAAEAELQQARASAARCIEYVEEACRALAGGEAWPVERSASVKAVVAPASPSGRVAQGRILIADDNEKSRRALSKILERDGHTVACVGDGGAALASVAEQSFHVLILDLRMPVKDGFEVLAELRQRKLLQRVAVIVVSGSSDEDCASAAIRLGAEAYLTRPVETRHFRAKVNSCVEQQLHQEAEREMVNPVYATLLSEPLAEYGALTFRAYLESLMDVGGDCYFHQALEGGAILAGVADVSGDGWPAALDMARVATLVAHTAPQCGTDDFCGWLVRLNESLRRLMRKGGNNVALTALLVEPARRVVQIACFGQHPPFYRDAEGSFARLPCAGQGKLGLRVLKQCRVETFPLGLSSVWGLCSDGVTEARDLRGGELGHDGFLRLLEACDWSAGGRASEPVERWKAALPNGPSDDATLLLMIDRTPPPPAEWVGLSRPEALQEARAFFRAWGVHGGAAPATLDTLLIGCDEILTNILRHGYGEENRDGEIRATAVIEPTLLRFTIRHLGSALGPEEALQALAAPRREVGGSGLALAHRVFSRVQFERNADSPGGSVMLEKDEPWRG